MIHRRIRRGNEKLDGRDTRARRPNHHCLVGVRNFERDRTGLTRNLHQQLDRGPCVKRPIEGVSARDRKEPGQFDIWIDNLKATSAGWVRPQTNTRRFAHSMPLRPDVEPFRIYGTTPACTQTLRTDRSLEDRASNSSAVDLMKHRRLTELRNEIRGHRMMHRRRVHIHRDSGALKDSGSMGGPSCFETRACALTRAEQPKQEYVCIGRKVFLLRSSNRAESEIAQKRSRSGRVGREHENSVPRLEAVSNDPGSLLQGSGCRTPVPKTPKSDAVETGHQKCDCGEPEYHRGSGTRNWGGRGHTLAKWLPARLSFCSMAFMRWFQRALMTAALAFLFIDGWLHGSASAGTSKATSIDNKFTARFSALESRYRVLKLGDPQTTLAPSGITEATSRRTDLAAPDVLSHENVEAVFLRNVRDIANCLKKQRRTEPDFAPDLVLDIAIRRNGQVSQVAIAPKRVEKSVFGACVLRKLPYWKFPRFSGEMEGGTVVEVVNASLPVSLGD
jgi:hypothetical protein